MKVPKTEHPRMACMVYCPISKCGGEAGISQQGALQLTLLPPQTINLGNQRQ